jgi:hypothetical protein
MRVPDDDNPMAFIVGLEQSGLGRLKNLPDGSLVGGGDGGLRGVSRCAAKMAAPDLCGEWPLLPNRLRSKRCRRTVRHPRTIVKKMLISRSESAQVGCDNARALLEPESCDFLRRC